MIQSFLPSIGYEEKKFDAENRKLAFATYPDNFGRALVLIEFIDMCKTRFTTKETLNIALIGGYENEPEIKILKLLNINFELKIFGIEADMHFFDLNEINDTSRDLDLGYDLILCSQVWEHIWNHNQAIRNIYNLMSKDTLLWLACPASNRPHSSPYYYSAGFSLDYLKHNLKLANLTILNGGQLGTRRNYRATHSIPNWLSVKGHIFPPFWAFSDRNLRKRFFLNLRFIHRTFDLLLFSSKVTSDIQCATETWVCAVKN